MRKYDGKEAEQIAYRKIKKDGTPAKPTGKRKEDPKVEQVYDPSIAEEYKREQEQKKANERARTEATERACRILEQEPLEVYAIKSRVLKDGYYKKSQNGSGMYLYGLSIQQEQVWLQETDWIRLSAEILLAMEQLGIKEV